MTKLKTKIWTEGKQTFREFNLLLISY